MRRRSGLERSQGKLRTRVPNLGLVDPPSFTGTTATDHEPVTGRFTRGNRAAQRRAVKASAPIIVGLDPSKCEPWLAPFAHLAGEHAANLIGELGVSSNTLSGLAIDTAAAMAVYRGLLSLGASGDRKALAEARAWLREARQNVITLTSLVGSQPRQAQSPADIARAMAEAGKPRPRGTP
jgi:hypothetical protein